MVEPDLNNSAAHSDGPAHPNNGRISPYDSMESMTKHADAMMAGDARAPNKRVTFSDGEPRLNGRPSVPGPTSTNVSNAASSRKPIPDAQFTEDISRQMRVPMNIRPYDEQTDQFLYGGFPSGAVAAQQMNVPDRILVAGHDQHMGLREQRPRELEFDEMLYGFRTEPNIAVQTPPRTLTVSQNPFNFPVGPADDVLPDGPLIAPMAASALDNSENSLALQAERNMTSATKQHRGTYQRTNSAVSTPSGNRAILAETPGGRLILDMHRRIEVLERENYHRYLREMVGYALLVGFIALKGMSFFLKR